MAIVIKRNIETSSGSTLEVTMEIKDYNREDIESLLVEHQDLADGLDDIKVDGYIINL